MNKKTLALLVLWMFSLSQISAHTFYLSTKGTSASRKFEPDPLVISTPEDNESQTYTFSGYKIEGGYKMRFNSYFIAPKLIFLNETVLNQDYLNPTGTLKDESEFSSQTRLGIGVDLGTTLLERAKFNLPISVNTELYTGDSEDPVYLYIGASIEPGYTINETYSIHVPIEYGVYPFFENIPSQIGFGVKLSISK